MKISNCGVNHSNTSKTGVGRSSKPSPSSSSHCSGSSLSHIGILFNDKVNIISISAYYINDITYRMF